jgi:thioredoxin 1
VSLREVTDESFERDVLGAPGAVLVDFWAQWCPPCRILTPILEELATEHPELTIVKVNADDNPVTAARYQALSLPTLKVFESGEVVRTLVGARPRRALESDLANWLS